MSKREKFLNASKERLGSIEKHLSGIFQPINPRKEFVNTVRQRIQVIREPNVVNRFTVYQIALVILLGIFILLVLIVMVVRALLSLFSKSGMKKVSNRSRKPLQVSS